MKIICVDNFNRDYKSDELVCENINEYYGKYIVNQLNTYFNGENSPLYFKLVPDDHKLYVFNP